MEHPRSWHVRVVRTERISPEKKAIRDPVKRHSKSVGVTWNGFLAGWEEDGARQVLFVVRRRRKRSPQEAQGRHSRGQKVKRGVIQVDISSQL